MTPTSIVPSGAKGGHLATHDSNINRARQLYEKTAIWQHMTPTSIVPDNFKTSRAAHDSNINRAT